jgi:transcriptional regulator with XRE-family HTH domain
MGYRQAYLSAVELGEKGPPNWVFMERLCSALGLNDAELAQVREAAEASERKIVLSVDSPPEAYWMLSELRKTIATLKPVQYRLICEVLRLPQSLQASDVPDAGRTTSGPCREELM